MSSYGREQSGSMKPIFQESPNSAVKSTAQDACPHAIHCTFLMNDIPRGTSYAKLMNSLLTPSHHSRFSHSSKTILPHVLCGLIIFDSRLDDDLSVATLEFSDTPQWLQDLDRDPHGFPKSTPFGTLWRGVDRNLRDNRGQTEFIRAVIKGTAGFGLYYAEMLAEFADTDVNIQDNDGLTALHWACAKGHPEMVAICLSVPDCIIGIRDSVSGRTAFDIAASNGNEAILTQFYSSMLALEATFPQQALLRILTITAEPSEADKPIFPGAAMFTPVETMNDPLVEALIRRGVDLAARNSDGDTALHVAVKHSTTGITKRLLEAGSDVGAVGSGQATPLHLVTCRTQKLDDRQDIVKLLLHHGADVGAVDGAGRTALELAQQNGTKDVVQMLQGIMADRLHRQTVERACVAVPVTPEVQSGLVMAERVVGVPTSEKKQEVRPPRIKRDSEAERDLTIDQAVEADRQEEKRRVVLALLHDIEAKDEKGETALYRAVADADLQVVKILLEVGSDVNTRDWKNNTVLHIAAACGARDMLVKSGMYFLVSQNSSLATGDSMERRHEKNQVYLEIIKTLLASKVEIESVNDVGYTALHVAAMGGTTELINELLAHGADVDRTATLDLYTPLHLAVMKGYLHSIKELLAGGAQVEKTTKTGCTALHLTISMNDGISRAEIIASLLASGANLEHECTDGMTALHHAAIGQQTATVNLLLASGANIEAVDRHGDRVLHMAVNLGDLKTVKVLLASEAQIAAINMIGRNTLHVAVWRACHTSLGEGGAWYIELINMLVAAGAEVDATGGDSYTALHMASSLGNVNIIKALLALGANINAPSVDGTPLQIASQHRYNAAVGVLRAHGARPLSGRFGLAMRSLFGREDKQNE